MRQAGLRAQFSESRTVAVCGCSIVGSAPRSTEGPKLSSVDHTDLPLAGFAPERPKPRRPKDITFKGGLDSAFHRWFRLTPSYSPTLVSEWLERFAPAIEGPVLDPFLGAGTTCIVASEMGLDSVGFEINPFLAFVGRVSSDWSVNWEDLATAGELVLAQTSEWLRELPDDYEKFAEELNTLPPLIHNVTRWWRPDVLREMIAIREACKSHGGVTTDHLLLALSQIVYSSASITMGRLQVSFKDRSNDTIEPRELFLDALQVMVEDLRAVPKDAGTVQVINGDSRDLAELELSPGAVFCSPPYPNRYSYIWNTRPHLYLLEMIDTPKAAADIDCDTLAGTWGRATSLMQKGRVDPTENVEMAMGKTLDELESASMFMRNYCCKYFNDLDAHLGAVRDRVAAKTPIGYVVGNSETNGVMVETHEILAGLMTANQFKVDEVESLRARNSGAGLVEVTVTSHAK